MTWPKDNGAGKDFSGRKMAVKEWSKLSLFNVVHALIYIMNKPKIPVRKYHTKSLFSDQIPISGYINVPGTNAWRKLHFLQHYVIRKKNKFWKWIRK